MPSTSSMTYSLSLRPQMTRLLALAITCISDKVALQMMPEEAIFLYRESETETGLPYIVIYEEEREVEQ